MKADSSFIVEYSVIVKVFDEQFSITDDIDVFSRIKSRARPWDSDMTTKSIILF